MSLVYAEKSVYRDGLNSGPVLLSKSQAEKSNKFTQPRDHFSAHLGTYLFLEPSSQKHKWRSDAVRKNIMEKLPRLFKRTEFSKPRKKLITKKHFIQANATSLLCITNGGGGGRSSCSSVSQSDRTRKRRGCPPSSSWQSLRAAWTATCTAPCSCPAPCPLSGPTAPGTLWETATAQTPAPPAEFTNYDTPRVLTAQMQWCVQPMFGLTTILFS